MKQGITFKIVCAMQLSMAVMVQGTCVLDGMNLWKLSAQMAAKIGSATEVNNSNYSSVVTGPGYYRVCENLTGSGVMKINFNDVILDLGGYATDNLRIQINASNVMVRNGTMRNAADFIDITAGTQNIIVEDLLLESIVKANDIPSFGIRALTTSDPITNVVIRNVTIIDGAPENIIVAGLASESVYITGVTIENVKMIRTSSNFTSDDVLSSGGALHLDACKDVVIKNIEIIDQISEENGVWIDTCNNVQVDGVSISTSQGSPDGFNPVAYRVRDCFTGIHKNITIDGGSSRVYAQGIYSSFSDGNNEPTVYDTYFITNISGDGATHTFLDHVSNATVSQCGSRGFVSVGSSMFTNCSSSTNSIGFVTNAFDVIAGCIAEGNVSNGFAVEGAEISFVDSKALFNGAFGFYIFNIDDPASVNKCNFDSCTSNYNAGEGFLVSAFNCAFNDCIADYNGLSGYSVAGNTHKFYNCQADSNTCAGSTDAGFSITANSSTFYGCKANNNLGSIAIGSVNSGFYIHADACSVDECVANANVSGFIIQVPSLVGGCSVTNSVANGNGFFGFGVLGVQAEATFLAGVPQNGTWNIGALPIANVGTTTDRNVRITNCIALRNLSSGFAMGGTVYAAGNTGIFSLFSTTIFPTIGIVIDTSGATFFNAKPIAVGTMFGAATLNANRVVPAFGCNFSDNNLS